MNVTHTSSLEQLWADAEFMPNDEQKEAILYSDGPLYLPAGPGSGKTRVLLWRTLNLIIFHDIKPDEIFLSTFTEKAAFQLREGLRALLGAITIKTNVHFDISNMYVGTVHSLCRRIVTDRRFSPERKRRRAPLLMDEIDQYLYLYKRVRWGNLTSCVELGDDPNECINKYFTSKGSKSKHNAVANCIALFNRFSEEHIKPEVALRATQDPDLKNLLSLYKKYLKSLEEPPPAGTVDLSLIQQKAVDILRNFPDAGKIFKHVIIDEYQDTNPIQEELFFELARGYKNICVVGDDDQGLYRFRGATVENFVQFPERCEQELGQKPHQIRLVKNYRSRRKIVSFYNDFITSWDWTKRGDGKGKQVWRIDKEIDAMSKDEGPSVIVSKPGDRKTVCIEIAGLIRKLLDAGTVTDPNQIAFLFPSLKSVTVQSMKQALEDLNIKVYAPRAGRFLEVPEAEAMFGVMVQILGRPPRGSFPGTDYDNFHDWLDQVDSLGKQLVKADAQLKQYVTERKQEIKSALTDNSLLMDFVREKKWNLQSEYKIDMMKRALIGVSGLSDRARRSLSSSYFDRIVRQRFQDYRNDLSDRTPFTLNYVIRRATAMDWSLLDLFYRVCGCQPFKSMFDLAENGQDEGPIANLGLISQYLERFIEQYTPMITADILIDDRLQNLFFGSYLFALFRRGESEYEDVEDPFPEVAFPLLLFTKLKGLNFRLWLSEMRFGEITAFAGLKRL